MCYNGGMKNKNAEKRKETLYIREAMQGMGKKALVVAAAAGALNFVGSKLNKELMDTKWAKDTEVLRVDGITIYNDPNVRRDPEVPGNPEDSNILGKLDNDGQLIELPYEGEVLVYDGPNDANGDWYGFPAEKFTETLHDAGYIDKKTEEEIVKRDKDGYVWVNGGYVELHGTETENTGANS